MHLIDVNDRTGRVKVTHRERMIAANRAIIESTSPLTITPGMWEALSQRINPHRRGVANGHDSRRRIGALYRSLCRSLRRWRSG